jgi:hypothetical protein
MSRAWGVRIVTLIALIASIFVAGAPTAAAHDPDCLTSLHIGPLQVHEYCDGHRYDDSECLLTFKLMFVHEQLGCD